MFFELIIPASCDQCGGGGHEVRQADGSKDVSVDGPFDVILLSGSVAEVPQSLLAQLKVGGRLMAIVGEEPVMQATIVTRTSQTDYRTTRSTTLDAAVVARPVSWPLSASVVGGVVSLASGLVGTSPVSAALVVAGGAAAHAAGGPSRRTDWAGFVLLAVFMVALVFGLHALPEVRTAPLAAAGPFALQHKLPLQRALHLATEAPGPRLRADVADADLDLDLVCEYKL